MFLKFDYFVDDKPNAKQVEDKTDPKNLDLILGNNRKSSGNTKYWQNISQIVRATRDHRERGSCSGYGHGLLSHNHTVVFNELFPIRVQTNLNSKSHR